MSKEIETDIVITDPDVEVGIEVDYRCYFDTDKAFFPMTVCGSIFKGKSLRDFIRQGKVNYEKKYLKVEVVNIRVDDEPYLAIDKTKTP